MLKNATVTINVISDSSKLLEMEGAWNKFIKNCSENPFLLSGFIKQYMELNRSRGWTPLILVVSANSEIVGISPLKTKRKFGVQFVKFSSKFWLSPGFISNDQYREVYISQILDFLFKTLKVQFVDLDMPAGSPNLGIIKQECNARKIHFHALPEMGCLILPIECTWAEFEKLRGTEFRREFKCAERNLGRFGSWCTTCVEIRNEGSEVFKKILDVEQRSWKEEQLTRRGKIDPDLLVIWEGSQHLVSIEPDFKLNAWFLELNGQTLAYVLVPQYKKVAIFAKTSYDQRYRRFYPGKYVMNAAIRDFFNQAKIRKIDFLTDLPVAHTWTSLSLPRVRVVMTRNRVLSTVIRFALSNYMMKRILAQMSKKTRTRFLDLFY